jgi:hypothetical protein
MVMTDLEKLRRLSEYADLISNAAVDAEDARGRIGQMIVRAEEDIRTKSIEIEVRESQINLLRHIADVLPLQANGPAKVSVSQSGRMPAQANSLKN